MNNTEIAHTFAHRNYGNNNGRHGSNFYSEGNSETLFSYGSHFPICSHIRGADHNGYELLFTTRSYSVSTSKHLNYASCATSHLQTLYCHNPLSAKNGIHGENLNQYMIDALENAQAYRGKETSADRRRLEDLIYSNETYLEYKKAFGLTFEDIKKCAPDSLKTYRKLNSKNSDLVATAKTLGKKYQQAKKTEKATARKRALLEAKKALPEFLATGKRHHSLSKAPIALRIDNEGRVQTSHGATVPASSALDLYKLAKGCRIAGISYKPETYYRVGHYNLTKIDQNGNAQIGCHYLPFQTMADFAPQLTKTLCA